MKQLTFFLLIFLFSCSETQITEEWSLFYEQDSGFEIEFPGEPIYSKERAIFPLYGIYDVDCYSLEIENNDSNLAYHIRKFMLTDSVYINRVMADPYIFFLNLNISTSQNLKGEILKQEEVKYNSYLGNESKISFENKKYILTMRTFIIDSTVFAIQTLCESQNDNNEAQKRFFESFKITSE